MRAIAAGAPPIARLLIARGAEAAAESTNGFSPILFAAEYGDAATARALIAAGADPHVTSPLGRPRFSSRWRKVTTT